jgi:predicted DNA binding CopG/RHH family protein
MIKNKDFKLSKEEERIENALTRGEFVGVADLKTTKKMFEEAAKNYRHLSKSKRITIRVNQEDLIKVKARAQRSKVPYQTLLNALIHQFATGRARVEL